MTITIPWWAVPIMTVAIAVWFALQMGERLGVAVLLIGGGFIAAVAFVAGKFFG